MKHKATAEPEPYSDALAPYRSKRNFALTSEPSGDDSVGLEATTFVVQKHWASHLHYDLRLELGGTMKSWAIPKGPSLDPKHKRMAVQVEDHPRSYSSFEGTIAPGQYGAGKVIVWDQGSWSPLNEPVEGLRSGHLKFELRGHKLQGKWALVRMKGDKPWLLIKENDEFARTAAQFSVVDESPDSVLSGPAAAVPVRPVRRPAAPDRKPAHRAGAAAKPSRRGVLPVGAPKARLPATLAPELATLVDALPEPAQEWLYEIKFDGYRMLARIERGSIRLVTRNGHDWTAKLEPLRLALADLKLPSGWYDGEIVVLNERGVPDFGALQQSLIDSARDPITFHLFDVPYCDGHDLRDTPLEARRNLLAHLLKHSGEPIRFSAAFDAEPRSVVASACKLGLEGIIAKRRDSRYVSRRSPDWIKLKCVQRQEFVIGGFTDPQGARTGLGALLLGVHDATGALQYVGNVGTGFGERALVDLAKRLGGLRTDDKPFAGGAKIAGRPHWVRPALVAEVSFGGWTQRGRIRHAVFQGLRQDKAPGSIVREHASHAPRGAGANAPAAMPGFAKRLRVTHPERVVDASSGVTKIELVRYYGLVGALMMPHLKDRPVALVRAPAGVAGELFFQKHAQLEKMTGMRQLDPALDPGHAPMIAVAQARGIVSAAQWNVVEFHTVNARAAAFERPDRMVFDLDPGEAVSWTQVQEGAELLHAFLMQLGLAAFLKTSGGKGLHVVVPLRKAHDWATVKGFSQAIVTHMAQTLPQRFVAKSGPRNRVRKIFIDYLRNGQSATTVSAWSARARPGLGISVPVDWRELDALRGGNHWTVRSAHTRLDRGNDPWSGYARAAHGLTRAMSLLEFKPASASTTAKGTPARVVND
ncbi:MAG: DNA ligase D [Burkholderiaceae bacterium]